MGVEILPPTMLELGALEPVRARRWSRGANPATRPTDSPILRLRPRVIRDDVGGVLDGRYFGVGNIALGDVVVVPTLDASTSSKFS